MKPKKIMINMGTTVVVMNKVLLALILMIGTDSAMAGSVCGRFIKGSKKAQLIPEQGKISAKIFENDPLTCGSTVITNAEPVWVEMNDLTVFKIASASFFEFAKSGKSKHQLYRGAIMVSAPPSIKGMELATPNSNTEFNGGALMLNYDPNEKETLVSNFNRKVVFKNKFHPEASQVVAAGEMSRLWINEDRLIPTEPEIMDSKSVKPAVAGFAIADDELKQMVGVIDRAVESRSKSFVTDLESWEELEQEQQRQAERKIASVDGKGNSKEDPVSIELKEAERALNLLKTHLYGEESDWKIHDESRKPSSVSGVEFKDPEYDRKKAIEKEQVKKTVEAIKNFE